MLAHCHKRSLCKGKSKVESKDPDRWQHTTLSTDAGFEDGGFKDGAKNQGMKAATRSQESQINILFRTTVPLTS